MQDARDTMTRMHQAQQRKMDKEMQELRFMNSQLLAEVAKERDRARASFKKVDCILFAISCKLYSYRSAAVVVRWRSWGKK